MRAYFRKNLLIASVSFFALGITNSYAQMAVYDATSYQQLLAQLQAAEREYSKQLEELDTALAQTNAMTGTRSMGDLMNGALEKELRRSLPQSWDETLNLLSSNADPQITALYQSYMDEYSPINGAALFKSAPDGNLAKSYERSLQSNLSSMALSEAAFNNTNNKLETLENLLDELNNTQDLKASVDLQARISAENGFLLSELLRLQAIAIQQDASLQGEQFSKRKQSHEAHQFDAGASGEAMRLQNSH